MLLFYDNPSYEQPNSFSLCSFLMIDDFNPKSISAGTGDTLTITGSGFGCYRGSGNVLFKDARFGGDTDMGYLNGIDYISWSKNEIKLIHSYLVDSLDVNQFPGSGYFSIENNSSLTISSPSQIEFNTG